MTEYVTYYRVSTKRQGDSGLGLEAQRAFIQHYYHDKRVIASFTDIRSGKEVQNRPELQKALALCKERKAVLVVAKIDRLSRNTEQALAIYRELDGRLESCDIPNLDKFTLTLFMAIADRERELIGLRTKQALDQKRLQQGEWRVGGPNEKKMAAAQIGASMLKVMATTNENNQRAQALILSLKETGMTFTAIAEQLNRAKFKTSRGFPFRAEQVKRIYERAQVIAQDSDF